MEFLEGWLIEYLYATHPDEQTAKTVRGKSLVAHVECLASSMPVAVPQDELTRTDRAERLTCMVDL